MKTKRMVKETILLLAIMIISIIISTHFMWNEYLKIGEKEYSPQINRAVREIADILPVMEDAENSLRGYYEVIESNRQHFLNTKQIDEETYNIDSESIDDLVKETLSWQDRIIELRIGESGGVFVTTKDGMIVAHPKKSYVGDEIAFADGLSAQTYDIIKYKDLKEDIENGVAKYEPEIIILSDASDEEEYFEEAYYGSIIEYNDYYIVCGVPYDEYIGYVLGLDFEFYIGVLIVLWILFRFIMFNMSKQTHTARQVLFELITVAVVLSLGVFWLGWYNQTQAVVSQNLSRVSEDADYAVEIIDDNEVKKEKIHEWLENQYLIQGRIARDIVETVGVENITREELAGYSDALSVEAIYVFDKDGKVIVTDGPYDHFQLSEDEEDPSYEFRVLLEGADHLVQEPIVDDVTGEYYQFIGVGLRDENDLSNGLIQIAVDPAIHDALLSTLEIDNVLNNLKVGVTEEAFAVDKKSMKVSYTTGLVFEGNKITNLGLDEKEIKGGINGFVDINYKSYYAACSENSDYFFITLKKRRSLLITLKVLLEGTIMCLGIMFIMIIPAYLIMKKTFVQMDSTDEGEADIMEAYVTGEGNFDKETPDDIVEKNGFFDGIKDKFVLPPKPRFDARWKVDNVPFSKRTPQQQLMVVIYRIMFVGCMLSLSAALVNSLFGYSGVGYNLAYQAAADNAWKKGINIFALSSCVNMLCTMYVVVIVLTQILYRIARVASMHIETICMLIRNSLKYICFLIFVFYWLSQFGVKTATLLASAGIMSVVIGIGAKDLINDIIAGFFMIFEGSFKVGDWVKVGDWIGMIREIGIRTTKVEFFSETMVLNNSSMRDVAVTDGPTTYLRINLPVSYSVDLEWLEGILEEELPKIVDKLPLIKRAKYQGINDFTSNAMIIRIYIFTVSYKRGPALRQFNRELKLLFDRNGIEFPVNQISIQQNSVQGQKGFDNDIDLSEYNVDPETTSIGYDTEDGVEDAQS